VGSVGGTEPPTHQRISEYVRESVERYRALGFSPREEWIVEQTMAALRRLLDDVDCSEPERAAVLAFLDLATERRPGSP
jgi:hypothetical protein